MSITHKFKGYLKDYYASGSVPLKALLRGILDGLSNRVYGSNFEIPKTHRVELQSLQRYNLFGLF